MDFSDIKNSIVNYMDLDNFESKSSLSSNKVCLIRHQGIEISYKTGPKQYDL